MIDSTATIEQRKRKMTNWDERLFTDVTVEEFLEELEAEYSDSAADEGIDTVITALEDAVVIACKQAARGDEEYRIGLGAASIASIWNGAPYSVSDIADQFSLIREGIGERTDLLQERSAQLLEMESDALEAAGEDIPEGLETYLEALS